jgi:hypothetical protein
MVYFLLLLGKFWKVLKWKLLEYFMNIWSILQPVDIFYDHIVYFVAIWHSVLRSGILHQKIWQPWTIGLKGTFREVHLVKHETLALDLEDDELHAGAHERLAALEVVDEALRRRLER